MTVEEYKKQFTEDNAVGWDCIDQALKKVYGDTEPRHYGPLCGIHYAIGGEDPIDGVSIYDSDKQQPHLHIVSYGMSELYYNEESSGNEFSKWGFEFSFRLKPFSEDKGDPGWALHMMNNLARYVYSSQKWFEENHFIAANGPIRLNTDTAICGFVFALDPELGRIDTPHGEVAFLQLVGITDQELQRLKESPTTDTVAALIAELKKDNPMLITDLDRK